MATRLGNRARSLIEQAWPELISAVYEGEPLDPIYLKHGLRGDSVRVYRLENPECDKEWQVAREQSADTFAEKVVEIAENPGADSGIARVRMDAYRWLAAKRNPRTYSDKSTVDLNVRTVDLTKIIGDANARLAAARVIEGVVVREILPAPELAELL